MKAVVFWVPRMSGALLEVRVEGESPSECAAQAHEVAAACWRDGLGYESEISVRPYDCYVEDRSHLDPTGAARVHLLLHSHTPAAEFKERVEQIVVKTIGG